MKWSLPSGPLLLLLLSVSPSLHAATAAAAGLAQITPAPCASTDGKCLAASYLALNLPHVRIGGVAGVNGLLHARQAVSSPGGEVNTPAGGGGAAASTPAGGGGGGANGGAGNTPTPTPVDPPPTPSGGGGAAGGDPPTRTPIVPPPADRTSVPPAVITPVDDPASAVGQPSTAVVAGVTVVTTVRRTAATPAPGNANAGKGSNSSSSSATPGATNDSAKDTAGVKESGVNKPALIAGLSVAAAAVVLAGIGIFMFRKLGLKPSARFRERLNGLGIGHGGGDSTAAVGAAAAAGVAGGAAAGSAGRPVSVTPNVRDKLFLHDPHEQIAVHAARTSPSPLPSESGTMATAMPGNTYPLHHAAPAAAAPAAGPAAHHYYNYGGRYAQHPAPPGSDYGGGGMQHAAQQPQAYQNYLPGYQQAYYDPSYPRQ
ncbi:hypothetical protein HDU86_007523 [Geranomyces michiganensis]|nr:hypothetical protein HDU86_007523 [Geranomyces michiganensis]